jgi:hypothetical protein
VFIYYRTGSYVPAFRENRADSRLQAPTRCTLNELLAEGLIAQTFSLSPANEKLDIQIIFEGTVRIVRSEPGSPTSASSASVNTFDPTLRPKLVSVSTARRKLIARP